LPQTFFSTKAVALRSHTSPSTSLEEANQIDDAMRSPPPQPSKLGNRKKCATLKIELFLKLHFLATYQANIQKLICLERA
jgi:hypothetical protein